MKTLITFLLSLIVCGNIHAQTMIYSQNFNSGSAPEWALNSTATIAGIAGTNSAPTGNEWLINNIYAAGTFGTATPGETAGITGYPNSYYLHMNCGTSESALYGSNDNYLASGSGQVYMAVMTTPQVTTGYTNVYFSFWWLCRGDATGDEGNVYYSTDGGATWTQITGVNFYSVTSWTVDSFHLAAFDNQASLEFAFTFTDANTSAHDPEFAVDDISLYGTPGATPVTSYSVTATSACQDSCITATSTTTGSVDSVRWSVIPTAGATINTPTATATSICFTTAGTYSVTLTAYSGGLSDAATNAIIVIPTPSPVIVNNPATHTLSVTGAYTAYQWAMGSPIPSAIAGATNSTYTYTVTGTYYVGVDSDGCQGYSPVPFVYTSTGVANINNNVNNKYWLAGSGDVLNIYASRALDETLTINIYDATGRRISNDTWESGSDTKQLSSTYLQPGLYVIRLSNDKTSTVFRWVK